MSTKRILSLVLALVMVLGTFGTLVSAEEAALDHKVQWLIDQGLLQGDGSGNYDLDKAIQRSVLARIVAVALQDEASALALQSVPSGFADMTTAHWANGYAAYANAKGYMIGNEKREFMPNAVVNYDQALVVLTKVALGRDLTAEEKAGALTWYAPYVAKANEIGVTEGVSITNVGAPAIKEDIVKMLYNVLNSKKFGNYTVLKAIVLENDRISRVGANEVTVEVIREVQRADFVTESRKFVGEQYTFELPAKANAEDLLGKVVDLSIDKNDKVVEVVVDESYKVLTGAVTGITSSRLTMGGSQYIVNFEERYTGDDERIYRTYLNDKDYKYADFAKDNSAVEYARVTVKAGKVYFVDAYNFDDIMPVKEVKEVRGKDTIVSYDDVRNGNTIETAVSTARVILVNDKTFTRGTLENVKADNVIHTYKDARGVTKYVVLQDKAITGELERIREERNEVNYYVVVDGEAYGLPTKSPKEAVYEFETDGKFYTLVAADAYRQLDTFRGENVRVLLGLDGKVQYIGSDVGFGEFMGVATQIVGRDMRVLNPDNKLNDYKANLDTAIYVEDTKTSHRALNDIDLNSLVYVNADEDTLVTVRDFDNQVVVEDGFTARNINGLRITDDTVVYVVNSNGRAEVRKIADVVKAYEKLGVADQAKVRVSLIDEERYDDISVRGYQLANPNHVHTMVIYNVNITPAHKDAVYGKLIRYTDRQAFGRSTILVELANGSERTFTLAGSVDEDAINFVKGNIYVIEESKETEDLALFMEEVTFSHGVVDQIRNSLYIFKANSDDAELYEIRGTEIFGRRPRSGDSISYVKDGNDMVLIVNPGFAPTTPPPSTTGVVTYINGTTAVTDKIELTAANAGDTTIATALDFSVKYKSASDADTTIKVGEATAKLYDNSTSALVKSDANVTELLILKGSESEILDATTINGETLTVGKTYTLRVEVKVGDKTTNKDITVVVKPHATDVSNVQDDKAALTIAGDLANVTANLTLASTGTKGSTITWESSDVTVLEDSTGTAGNVHQPAFADGDKVVTLTATIKSGNVEDTKVFTVTVKAAAMTDAEKMAADKAALTIAGDLNNVIDDLTLATTGANGSTITWASSNTAIVDTDGTVVRPAGANVQVTLTASIVSGAETAITKVFYVTVLGE